MQKAVISVVLTTLCLVTVNCFCLINTNLLYSWVHLILWLRGVKMLPQVKSWSGDTDTILQTRLDAWLITEFQPQDNTKRKVGSHNKIAFQHINFQERERWKNRITTCSICCRSHQTSDWDGKEKQEHGIKLHQHWNQAYYQPHITDILLYEPKQGKITGPWTAFTFLRKPARCCRKQLEKILHLC